MISLPELKSLRTEKVINGLEENCTLLLPWSRKTWDLCFLTFSNVHLPNLNGYVIWFHLFLPDIFSYVSQIIDPFFHLLGLSFVSIFPSRLKTTHYMLLLLLLPILFTELINFLVYVFLFLSWSYVLMSRVTYYFYRFSHISSLLPEAPYFDLFQYIPS